MGDLSELAALAAEKVPGFVRPAQRCQHCQNGVYADCDLCGEDCPSIGTSCTSCEGAAVITDDSPAALLMAVVLFSVDVPSGIAHFDRNGSGAIACHVYPGDANRGGRGEVPVPHAVRPAPEDVARAALTALLAAHGVEVSE